MVPAQQRFEAHDRVALEVDLGLVVQRELVERQGLAQVDLEVAAGRRARVHVRVEEAERASPGALDVV